MSKKVCSIKTNWKIVHGNEIVNSITAEFIKDKSLAKSANIDDFTGAQRAILLTKAIKQEEPEMCHIKLRCASESGTPLVTLISDCSKIELFTGSYEEYLKICHGELLDEFEGTKSYIFEFYFPELVNDILLKFITSEEQIWIYGIHIYLVETPPINLFRPTIDIANVQCMLAQSNCHISENAEKCKEFIKMHMNTNRNAGPPNMAALMSFINGKIDGRIVEMDMAKIPSTFDGRESNGNASESDDTDTKNMESLEKIDSNSVALAKLYIDGKITDLERMLTRKIDERFDKYEMKMNRQFEKIFDLLQNRK